MSASPVVARNQFWLDLRTEEGRSQVAIDLTTFTKPERLFIGKLLASAVEGKQIIFGVGEDEGGNSVMQFTFVDPIKAAQAEAANVVKS